MTIAIAWTRRILNCEELVFVSDSRLSKDGRIFDAAPKALTLSRNDCAIAFAGLTQDAFPMMLQFSLAISSYRVAQRRSMDLSELKTHGLKIFDAMATLLQSDAHVIGAPQDDIPAAEFLFGGYSWIKKEFELWRIRFDKTRRRFVAIEAQWAYFDPLRRRVHMDHLARSERKTAIGRIAFAGDQAPKAKRLFSQMMARRYREGEEISKIDMEPFDILTGMLRDPDHSSTIGGAPQLIKVYQYMQAVSFPIYWPDKQSGRRFLQGRPCLGYENLDTKIVDPDNHSWPTNPVDPLSDTSTAED